jgi:hypothetical protein
MRNHSVLVMTMMILWAGAAADARYSGGTGEPNNPYRIATPQDLNDIGNHQEDWDKHFILINDVNLAQYTGTQFKIIGPIYNTPFTGVFDGNDHKVWNFTWNSTGRNCIGLFGNVSSGQIKNLGMENVDVNAGSGGYVGGLVGCNSWRSTITNCYSTGSVSGLHIVGGLVGGNEYGTVSNCYSTGSVTAIGSYSSVGGLVGYNGNGTITNCYFTGSVSGGWQVGGLVGENYWCGTITNCYSTGNVTGTEGVGGLVGGNSGIITDSYSTILVRGEGSVGGLVGSNVLLFGNSPGVIAKCYSTGSVSGTSSVGGLVGINQGYMQHCNEEICWYEWHYGTVTVSFWDIQTSDCNTSDGGTGKTTAEMKTLATFTDAGWDFVEIWGIGENQTYPYLRFAPAGDANYDKKVDLVDLAILSLHWLEGPP